MSYSPDADTELRSTCMTLKSYKECSSTPSYAQPTISFTKHQKAENKTKKSERDSPSKFVKLRKPILKPDDRAFYLVSAADVSNSSSELNRKPNISTNNFEIYQDQPKSIHKTNSGFEKILISGYDRYYSFDENKENSSPIKKKELYFKEPMLKKTPSKFSKVNYDSNNNNNHNSNCSSSISNSCKPLQIRYEKPDSSTYLSSDSGDSLISKLQQQEVSEEASTGLPKEYLKSFTKNNHYVSATEWDSLIDIVEYYCQSLFDVKKKEIQELKSCKEDLENENKRLNNLINDLKSQLKVSNKIPDSENDETEIHKISNNSLRRPNSASSNSNSATINKTINSNTVLNVISTNPNGLEKALSHQKFNLEDGSELRLEEELRD